MGITTAQGYILLADLSGFVAYTMHTELDHAHSIIAELLELIVDHFEPVCGEATILNGTVMAFASAESVQRGEILLEACEETYAAFRQSQQSMLRNTTCTCKACQSVADLDLKFLIHYGEVIPGPNGNPAEMSGPDVQLIRERIIKDQASDASQRAYVMMTDRCLRQIGVQPTGMDRNEKLYPYYGQIGTASIDLHHRYDALISSRRVFVAAEDADLVQTHEFPVSRVELWDWFNEPSKRSQWTQGRHWTALDRPMGRTGVGARNHCAHGLGVAQEIILDWHPFDYLTIDLIAAPFGIALRQTYIFEELDENTTCLTVHSQLQNGRWALLPVLKGNLANILQHDYQRLGKLIAS